MQAQTRPSAIVFIGRLDRPIRKWTPLSPAGSGNGQRCGVGRSFLRGVDPGDREIFQAADSMCCRQYARACRCAPRSDGVGVALYRDAPLDRRLDRWPHRARRQRGLVAPDDAEGLRSPIRTILSDSDRAARLSTRAKRVGTLLDPTHRPFVAIRLPYWPRLRGLAAGMASRRIAIRRTMDFRPPLRARETADFTSGG